MLIALKKPGAVMTEYGFETVTIVYWVVTSPVVTDILALLLVQASGAPVGHVVLIVAPVTWAASRKLWTFALISVSFGRLFVPEAGATAKRAPSRAAFVKTCLVLRKRPASITPRSRMKNIMRITAPSTVVTPFSKLLSG